MAYGAGNGREEASGAGWQEVQGQADPHNPLSQWHSAQDHPHGGEGAGLALPGDEALVQEGDRDEGTGAAQGGAPGGGGAAHPEGVIPGFLAEDEERAAPPESDCLVPGQGGYAAEDALNSYQPFAASVEPPCRNPVRDAALPAHDGALDAGGVKEEDAPPLEVRKGRKRATGMQGGGGGGGKKHKAEKGASAYGGARGQMWVGREERLIQSDADRERFTRVVTFRQRYLGQTGAQGNVLLFAVVLFIRRGLFRAERAAEGAGHFVLQVDMPLEAMRWLAALFGFAWNEAAFLFPHLGFDFALHQDHQESGVKAPGNGRGPDQKQWADAWNRVGLTFRGDKGIGAQEAFFRGDLGRDLRRSKKASKEEWKTPTATLTIDGGEEAMAAFEELVGGGAPAAEEEAGTGTGGEDAAVEAIALDDAPAGDAAAETGTEAGGEVSEEWALVGGYAPAAAEAGMETGAGGEDAALEALEGVDAPGAAEAEAEVDEAWPVDWRSFLC